MGLRKWKSRPRPVMARYPKATTIPGTARGSIARASRSHPARCFPRTAAQAMKSPNAMASASAMPQYRRLLRMLGTVRECPSAVWMCSNVAACGKMRWYHPRPRASPMTPRCGRTPKNATRAKGAVAAAQANPRSFLGGVERPAFPLMAQASRPKRAFARRYAVAAATIMTVTRA